MTKALAITDLRHRYGDRVALDGLSLAIEPRQIYAILGPNGSGKSTLFKVASTLLPIQEGEIELLGLSVRRQSNEVRSLLGVVFQHPSLDRKLSVLENLQCGAALVGLRGQQRRTRIDEVAELLQLGDRMNDRAEKLSGGLKRRVELAKSILHRPAVLLLDEPSTGLDPAARLEYWRALEQLCHAGGTTAIMTTHLLEEADRADRIAVMNRGRVVAEGPPRQLRREMGDAVLTIESDDLDRTERLLAEQFGWESQRMTGYLRVCRSDAAERLGEVQHALGQDASSLTLARPSLEDVFIARTGESWEEK